MNKYIKKEIGITLIALVVTIIVMLILVGVTIRIAQNGNLFKYAANAVSKTKVAANQENELLDGNIYGKSIEDIVAENTGEKGEKFSSIYSNDANYTDKNGKTARIPKGFAVGKSSGINTVAGGLVITDSVTVDGTSNGNEFVWIPVDNISDFVRTDWANNDVKAFSNNNYIEIEDAAYNTMKASVQQWKGFYVARYGAGATAERVQNGTNSTSITPQSKKLLYPYNYINWADAKAVSEGMYTGNSDYGVTSTLCYGVQWDSTLRFIKNVKNVSSSKTWGNYKDNEFEYIGRYYSDSSYSGDNQWHDNNTPKLNGSSLLLQTGACDDNQAKNIYDLAGNVFEWTMERTSATGQVARSGCYANNGESGFPASYRRLFSDASVRVNYISFRPSLYVTSLT